MQINHHPPPSYIGASLCGPGAFQEMRPFPFHPRAHCSAPPPPPPPPSPMMPIILPMFSSTPAWLKARRNSNVRSRCRGCSP
eukprot:5377573-Pyramimonas_sp.AAC.1